MLSTLRRKMADVASGTNDTDSELGKFLLNWTESQSVRKESSRKKGRNTQPKSTQKGGANGTKSVKARRISNGAIERDTRKFYKKLQTFDDPLMAYLDVVSVTSMLTGNMKALHASFQLKSQRLRAKLEAAAAAEDESDLSDDEDEPPEYRDVGTQTSDADFKDLK